MKIKKILVESTVVYLKAGHKHGR